MVLEHREHFRCLLDVVKQRRLVTHRLFLLCLQFGALTR